MKILLVNITCFGYGDIIFIWKLSKLLKYKYKHLDIYIASPTPQKLYELSKMPKSKILRLYDPRNPSKDIIDSCINFSKLKIKKFTGKGKVNTNMFDLFLVGPLTDDPKIGYKWINKVIPTSNPNNTYFMTEYNDTNKYNSKLIKIKFHMGIGKNKDGLLIMPPSLNKIAPKSKINKLLGIKSKFSMAYVSSFESDTTVDICLLNFISLVTHKIKGKTVHQIILPDINIDINVNRIMKIIPNWYNTVTFMFKDEDFEEIKNENGTTDLVLRFDIYPVSNDIMLGLIKYSEKDILVTGDQSITDVFSCCKNKNIWYQRVPWKLSFANQLSILLPDKYLKTKKTSCGTPQALSYNMKDYSAFVKEWNFLNRAKDKLDKLFK